MTCQESLEELMRRELENCSDGDLEAGLTNSMDKLEAEANRKGVPLFMMSQINPGEYQRYVRLNKEFKRRRELDKEDE